jgi:hypothetical protein
MMREWAQKSIQDGSVSILTEAHIKLVVLRNLNANSEDDRSDSCIEGPQIRLMMIEVTKHSDVYEPMRTEMRDFREARRENLSLSLKSDPLFPSLSHAPASVARAWETL